MGKLVRVIAHWAVTKYKCDEVSKQHYHFIYEGDGKEVPGHFTPEANESTADGKYAAKYGERRIATGETSIGGEGQNVGVEIYAAPLGKTFTVLLVRPDGLACIISAGSNLRTFPLPEPGTEL